MQVIDLKKLYEIADGMEGEKVKIEDRKSVV